RTRGGDWMMVQGINHLTFSVTDLETTIQFYDNVIVAKLFSQGRRTAYFDLKGMWMALNKEAHSLRHEIHLTYTEIVISINEQDYHEMYKKLQRLQVTILPGRVRDVRDRKSIYFTDPDGHRFEFHTGTLQDRLTYYKEEKSHMKFYDEEGYS